MSNATLSVSISGSADELTVGDTASCSFTCYQATTHTRDFTATSDVVTANPFVVAVVKNIGDETLCVRVGSVNFAIPPGAVSVFPGCVGEVDGGTGTPTLEVPDGFSARALSSATRARITLLH